MENTEMVIQETKNEIVTEGVFSNIHNFKELYDIGKMFASSTLVPSAYQNKAMDCTIAVDMANRMGVSPMFVMQNLYIVKGKPSWSGQACMSMIKASPDFRDVKHVYVGDCGTDAWGCYVTATRISNGEEVRGPLVTIAMAKAEKWYSKPDKYGNETSKWQTMPELMLAYRAAAFFARVHIPNSLMGCAVEGEAEDISKQPLPTAPDPFEEEIKKEAEEIFK